MAFPPSIPINRPSLREMVAQAGLSQYLQLCLDPACLESYPGSGQVFNDLSDYQRDFYLGDTSSVSGVDPPFSGTAGSLDSTAYFSSTGGQGFIQSSGAIDSFFNSMHKPGWQWTVIELMYFTGSYGASFNTRAGVLTGKSNGVSIAALDIGSGSKYSSIFGNGGAQIVSQMPVLMSSLPVSSVNLMGIGSQYLSNTSRNFNSYYNGNFSSVNYTDAFAPTTGDAVVTRYGLTTDNSSYMASGRRVYGLMVFSKMFNQTDYDNLRIQVKIRHPGV